MKRIFLVSLLIALTVNAQKNQDSIKTFKKRVLDNIEIDLITSYYGQNGSNAAVTGGIGDEELTDLVTNISVSIPLGADNVLSIDATVSAYSSASSSNLNPFSGASTGGEDDDDDDDKYKGFPGDDDDGEGGSGQISGSPWVASSGASKSDVWANFNLSYVHSSDDRNKIYTLHFGVANEFDYFSLGGGVGFTHLFNKKNTEISLSSTVYLDQWHPQYPTEIKTYFKNNGNLNADYFEGVSILDALGNPTDKNSANTWRPVSDGLIQDKGRNTYALSLGFSQILTPKLQMALFSDITYQEGWLANPMQRVYFADKPDYYIGNPDNIPNYTSKSNRNTFQLADDFERLPDTRFKIPVGMRMHYYINEIFVVRAYYRYYYDDWGINSHTLSVEIPVKITDKFTLYPAYRYYNQTAAEYFAPYETHLTSQEFYTSDFDLSEYSADQYGLGVKYTDIFTKIKMWKLGIKSIHLDYKHYERSTGLTANIISLGVKLQM